MQHQHEQPTEEGKGDEELRVPLLHEAGRARWGLPSTAPQPSSAGATSQQTGTSTGLTSAAAGFRFAKPRVFQATEPLNSGVEDPGSLWRKQRLLMIVWLGLSVTSGLLTLLLLEIIQEANFGLIMFALAAILAMIPPLCYLFPSCTGRLDLHTQTKLTAVVGKVHACVNMVALGFVCLNLLGLSYAMSNGNSAALLFWLFPFPAVVLGGPAWLSWHMSRRAERAQLLLNPVSSGMVHV